MTSIIENAVPITVIVSSAVPSSFCHLRLLHRKLEALTGCPPNKFIRIIRLNKAKELLANPSLSIAAIALDCGYSDPGYFARVFKQEYGITPQEWRVKN